jgi:tryptophan synthase alpha chain
MQGNRVSETFSALAKKGERALACYVVAGYPDIKTSEKVVDALVAGGADIIELGIPFSDPIADGPTIQQAAHRALEGGVTPDRVLALARGLRKKHPGLPIMAMTYSNILVRTGFDAFIAKAKANGIDGFILPDMPVEEADAYLGSAKKHGMATAFLASPNTSDARLEKIVASSTGFLYLVSVYGITGARKGFESYTSDAIKKAKRVAAGRVPVGVGFGISSPAHARFMIDAGADAIIVGSAIVDRMARAKSGKAMAADLKGFASSLKKVCRQHKS